MMIKWAAQLNVVENQHADELLEYLWQRKVLDSKSRYEMVKYMLAWGYNVMLEEKRKEKKEVDINGDSIYNNETDKKAEVALND